MDKPLSLVRLFIVTRLLPVTGLTGLHAVVLSPQLFFDRALVPLDRVCPKFMKRASNAV